ncbi:transposase [Actinoplanes sp. NPDC051470]
MRSDRTASDRRSRRVRVSPGRVHFGNAACCASNTVWLQLALTGIDLLSWTQHLLLDGPLAAAEPKKLRYRLLHITAKLTRTARTTTLRLAAGWP